MSDAAQWTEQDSQTFIDYGRYFVPERERQLALIAALIPDRAGPARVLELSCGAGLLAEAILERRPLATLLGLDRSPAMLAAASERLARFGARFEARQFEIAASEWRAPAAPLRAVVSSLAVHHLDAGQKRALFRDVHAMLEPGGALVIADVVQTADERGAAVAASSWDEAVRQRSLALDGDERGLELFERQRWNMYRYPETDPSSIDHPSGLFEQLGWLADAGFVGVDVYWMLAGHAIYGARRAG